MSAAASLINPVFQGECAAVVFCDLTCKGQSDATAFAFGGEKWHEEITGIRQAWAGVGNGDLNLLVAPVPGEFDG